MAISLHCVDYLVLPTSLLTRSPLTHSLTRYILFAFSLIHSHARTLCVQSLMRRAYYGCLSYADSLIGKALAMLEDGGAAQDTIVTFIGDHGWHLGEHDMWSVCAHHIVLFSHPAHFPNNSSWSLHMCLLRILRSCASYSDRILLGITPVIAGCHTQV